MQWEVLPILTKGLSSTQRSHPQSMQALAKQLLLEGQPCLSTCDVGGQALSPVEENQSSSSGALCCSSLSLPSVKEVGVKRSPLSPQLLCSSSSNPTSSTVKEVYDARHLSVSCLPLPHRGAKVEDSTRGDSGMHPWPVRDSSPENVEL